MSLPESLLSTLLFAQINLDTTQHKTAFANQRPLTPTLSLVREGEIPALAGGLGRGSLHAAISLQGTTGPSPNLLLGIG